MTRWFVPSLKLWRSGLIAICLALPGASAAWAQGIYSTTITQPTAEVRSGPSTDAKMYVTNRLRQGEAVVVLEDRPDGWLAIRPPRGSFTWVLASHLKQVAVGQPNWVVVTAPGTKVSAMVGSSVDPTVRPTVEGAALVQGTQVRALGEPAGPEGARWLPIEPPEAERRYVFRDSVARPVGAPVGVVTGGASPVYAPNPLASAAPITGSIASMAGAPASSNLGMATKTCGQQMYDPAIRWNEAFSAEQAQQLPEAISLYLQLSQDFAATQPELVAQASNRVARLRGVMQVPGTPMPYPDQPYIRPFQGNYAGQPLAAPGQTASSVRLSAPFLPQGNTVSGPPNPGQPMPISPPVATGSTAFGATGGTGVLRRSGRNLDNRQMYLLESNNKLLGYVVPVPPLSLEAWVDKPVEVRGGMRYVSSIRANVLFATSGSATH